MIRIIPAFIALAACVPDAPARPSFQVDVLPILAANCVRCHGAPTLGGAPASFRLDAFERSALSDGAVHDGCGENPDDPAAAYMLCGASELAGIVALRIRDTAYPMPPRFPLDDYQLDVLQSWALQPERGDPRAQNRAPTIETVDVVHAATSVTIAVAVDDADGDIVSGVVHAQLGQVRSIVGAVSSGHARLVWDTSSLAGGTYQLLATLDDGAAPIEVAMGIITIEETP